MKNLHILPTDKPSRLVKIYNDVNRNNFTLKLDIEVNDSYKEYQNIYITSDEKIKERDKILSPTNEIQTCISLEKGIGTDNICWIRVKETTTLQQILNSHKIILTTDQDLIKDGVQAIDDVFLKWFVKNPSCEEVDLDTFSLGNKILFNVVFPKEEPKQETLEEAAERISKEHYVDQSDYWAIGVDSFKRGAKWQQERMYSEEEVLEILFESSCNNDIDKEEMKEWFEQFKKK